MISKVIFAWSAPLSSPYEVALFLRGTSSEVVVDAMLRSWAGSDHDDDVKTVMTSRC